jgi:arabinofuranan 3-O-arabinosyltransferase
LEKLIDDTIAAVRAAGTTPVVVASSRSIAEPAARPGAVIDGDPGTAWYAGVGDGNASLRLTWPAVRTITGLHLAFDRNVAVTVPQAITAIGADGTRGGLIDPQGFVFFDRPLRTAELTILFLNRFPARSYDPVANGYEFLPFGVGEVAALPDPLAAPVDLDRRVDLPCGSGPTLDANGTHLTTRVSASLRELLQLRQVPATVCDAKPVPLGAGMSRIVVAPSALATPVRVALSSIGPFSAAGDEVTVGAWDSVHRTITVTPDDHLRVLVVRENTNPGWTATIGGLTLAPVVLDGWQQGWYLPAGMGGKIVLTFQPDGVYRTALVGGGAAAAVLAVVALIPQGWRRTTRIPRLTRRRRWLAMALGFVALAAIGGPWSGAVLVVVLLLLAGYRVARGSLSKVDRRRGRLVVSWLRNWLPPLLVGAAGLAFWRSDDPHRDALPQLLSLTALTLLWLGLLGRPARARRRPVGELLPGQLDHVIADRRQGQPTRQHLKEGPAERAGELGAPAWPVDKSDYQGVP